MNYWRIPSWLNKEYPFQSNIEDNISFINCFSGANTERLIHFIVSGLHDPLVHF